MAVYEFQCESCGALFEQDLPMGSSVRPKCPACKSSRTTKVFSAAGIQFKGSGFYVTDSKPATSKDSKPAKAPETPASEPTAETKAAPVEKPAAPEAKKESKSKPKAG